MEPDPGYFEPGPPHVRPRFDDYDPSFPGGNCFDRYDQPPFPEGYRYRDSFEMGSTYPWDYYGTGPGRGPAAPDQYDRACSGHIIETDILDLQEVLEAVLDPKADILEAAGITTRR